MKKFTMLALAALTMAPASMSAASWEKTVTNATEFKAAWNAIGTGAPGETYTIICDWDPATLVSAGRNTQKTWTAGRLVIKSNQTEFDKMPQLQFAMQLEANATNAELGQRMSIIFENMNIVGINSYLIDHRFDLFADTIALRNCDIHGMARSILRFDGDKGTLQKEDETTGGAAMLSVDVIEIKGCKLHGTAQASGDNWSMIRTFIPVNSISITDNMIYDMPYTKSLWETRYVGNVPTTFNFSNNLVLLGENKILGNSFTMLNPADKLPAGSTLSIHNNIIVGPKAGLHIMHNDTCSYSNTKLVNVAGAVVYASNNVVDTESYMTFERNQEIFDASGDGAGNGSIIISESPNTTLADYEWFSWDAGTTFQEPAKDVYSMLKSNPWATTGGFVDANTGFGATYIGPSIAYIESFPVKANVNITVDGPKFCGYTIAPEKAQYYIGDEITITADGHNTYYRQYTNFEGWSDGSMEPSRTITLEGDINLTAKFSEKLNVVAAFDFTSVTGKDMFETKAEIYRDMNPEYQATYYAMNIDTISVDTIDADAKTYQYNMAQDGAVVRGVFPTRAEKFGEEEDIAKRMPVCSRRTVGTIKFVGRNFHVVELNTTGCSDLTFSCFVGTDNHASKKQYAEWSLDGTTWTRFATVELAESLLWYELTGKLPSDVDNKEKVYIRIIADFTSSDVENDYVYNIEGFLSEDTGELDAEALKVADIHEYIGNVLITTTTAAGISDIVSDNVENANAPVYNLMGMKVAKGTKGLMIQNGKKFIVK